MSIMQQLQQLAGEAAVPYSVVGCCEVDKHSSSLLFSRKAILDVIRQQGDLVYGRPPVSKARQFPREQWVEDWIDTTVDESLEDLKGDTQQRNGVVALCGAKIAALAGILGTIYSYTGSKCEETIYVYFFRILKIFLTYSKNV